uniref:Uncharacterized protein n=1 Tax=Nicotiana tabacum TaxID=4097 RepID=A0A1S3ZW83_TOBAC|nr:PREDICTED: uncharacterized protein LOC107791096 [Nicotiana tabacum]
MISKILASRLQKVMSFIIGKAQAGFIPGRKFADNIILAHELVMEEIGFPDMFIKWIMECIKTVNYTILANLGKSSVYFGRVKQDVKEQILAHLGFEQGSLPFKYLGIPLSIKKIALIQWQTLIEKITAKISSWTAKKLYYGGRVQLVQSVIFGIQAYWAQLFILPAKVLKMIEALCRSYIWSGTNTITRKALVAWEKICTPKSAGGHNLINLLLWNKAAIAKICWDLAHKQEKLWIRWINAYYIKQQQLQHMPIPYQASWMGTVISAIDSALRRKDSATDSVTGSARCMPRCSLRTGELFEGFLDPEKAFRTLNWANKKSK